jgi:hypothetical protein
MSLFPTIGADDNVVPRALLKSLEDSEMFVPLRTLPQPLAVELAVKDPVVFGSHRARR